MTFLPACLLWAWGPHEDRAGVGSSAVMGAGGGVNEVIHPVSGRHLELCVFNKDGIPVWGPLGGRPRT